MEKEETVGASGPTTLFSGLSPAISFLRGQWPALNCAVLPILGTYCTSFSGMPVPYAFFPAVSASSALPQRPRLTATFDNRVRAQPSLSDTWLRRGGRGFGTADWARRTHVVRLKRLSGEGPPAKGGAGLVSGGNSADAEGTLSTYPCLPGPNLQTEISRWKFSDSKLDLFTENLPWARYLTFWPIEPAQHLVYGGYSVNTSKRS